MAQYYMNKNAQSEGDHEVHKEGCGWIPLPQNQLALGDHATCQTAVAAAKKIDSHADGCKHCSLECHTK